MNRLLQLCAVPGVLNTRDCSLILCSQSKWGEIPCSEAHSLLWLQVKAPGLQAEIRSSPAPCLAPAKGDTTSLEL